MSELGRMINDAIDKAQELAGEMKAAGDKVIDVMQEQAPAVAESAHAKREEMARDAREHFPAMLDEGRKAADRAIDEGRDAALRMMDAAVHVADASIDAAKEMGVHASDAVKAAVERATGDDEGRRA
ncbi:MAG: hypothetical protein Q4B35_02865 [Slackia sp.]|nr:hypothetical protein [Slackia sp.]